MRAVLVCIFISKSGERNKINYSFNENIGVKVGSMLEINRAGSTAFTSQMAFGQEINMNHTVIPFSSSK